MTQIDRIVIFVILALALMYWIVAASQRTRFCTEMEAELKRTGATAVDCEWTP
jgi:hypothetical protein